MALDIILCLVLLALAAITFQRERNTKSPHFAQNLCVATLIAAAACNLYLLGSAFAKATEEMTQPSPGGFLTIAKNDNFNSYMIFGISLFPPVWIATILLCGVYARSLPTYIHTHTDFTLRENVTFLHTDGWIPIILSWYFIMTNETVLSLGLFEFLCSDSTTSSIARIITYCQAGSLLGIAVLTWPVLRSLAQATRLVAAHEKEAKFEAAMSKWCRTNQPLDASQISDVKKELGVGK